LISPRGNEIDAVVEVLESEAYDSPEKMAAAIIKAVVAELAKRDALGVAAGFAGEGPVLAVGPFYDQRSVQKYVESAQECGLETRVRRLGSPLPIGPPEDPKAACAGCEHDKVFHGSWGCGVFPDKKKRCPCLGY
jgi:hypothetical protein